MRVKKLSNTNYISPKHVKRVKASLPLDVRRSKTSLLKLPIMATLRLTLPTGCSDIAANKTERKGS